MKYETLFVYQGELHFEDFLRFMGKQKDDMGSEIMGTDLFWKSDIEDQNGWLMEIAEQIEYGEDCKHCVKRLRGYDYRLITHLGHNYLITLNNSLDFVVVDRRKGD